MRPPVFYDPATMEEVPLGDLNIARYYVHTDDRINKRNLTFHVVAVGGYGKPRLVSSHRSIKRARRVALKQSPLRHGPPGWRDTTHAV